MGTASMTYYIETNLICLAILSILKTQYSIRGNRTSSSIISYSHIITVSIILCISDMVAGVLRGQQKPFIHVLQEISNIVFDISLTLISFLWLRYVNIRQNSILGKTKSAHWAWSIPLIAITVVAILNPFTGFLFSIDSGGLYSRGPGLLFQWIITWFYLFVAATKVIVTLVREKNKQKRSELMPMLFFFIAPVTTGVLQLLFYGLIVTQVGITISLFLISTLNNRRMVLTDTLTGLDNRRSLSNFIESLGNSSSPMRLCILVLDLDQFKEINDHFGHEAGDQALIKASEVLKEIRKQTMMKLLVCRYGKDEFIVIARNCSDSDIQSIRQQIIDGFANTKFHLKTSIGCACGDFFNSDDIQQLVRRADKAMYKEKQSHHIGG